ncbi:2-phosphoxylose phosphatase 1 [Mactra antiquata]
MSTLCMVKTFSYLDMSTFHLICILVTIVLYSCSWYYCMSLTNDRFIMKHDITSHTDLDDQDHIINYCNTHQNVRGQEGMVKPGYTLKEVHIVLTPGFTDVSSKVKIQGQNYPVMSCSDRNESATWFTKFKTTSHTYNIANHNLHFKQFHPTFPDDCFYNHLTLHGLQQMISIGQHLHATYLSNYAHKKLTGHYSSTHVRSIPSQPSYQSLLAFLHGFQNDKQLHKTKIHESRGDFCEHNEVGLNTCNCARVRELSPFAFKSSLKGSYMFKDAFPHKEEIYNLLNLDNTTTASGVELLQLLTQYKCNDQSRSLCMSHKHCHQIDDQKLSVLHKTLAKSVISLYSDGNFREHSELRMYPFLEQLMMHVTRHDSSQTINVYMGDKHFMQYLLTTLNIFKNQVMPMASRLIFEVYRKNRGQLNEDDLYIRVLYNGEDITETMFLCSNYIENGLCRISRFQSFITVLREQYMKNC